MLSAKRIQQLREAQKRFRLKHPDRVRAAQTAWVNANPDKVRAKRERYVAKHRDEILATRRAKGKETRARSTEYMRDYLRAYYEKNAAILSARAHVYYRNNRTQILEHVRQFRIENKAIISARMQAWRLANPDAYKRWAEKNPAKLVANRARRRARLLNAPVNDFTVEQWLALQAYFRHRCAYCDKRCKGRLTQDHITPLSKGGAHTAINIVPACKSCNVRKYTGAPLSPVQPTMLP